MKYRSLLPLLLAAALLFTGCGDNPTNAPKEKVTNYGALVYGVYRIDNISYPDPKVQVIYKKLDGEIVIDSVKADWTVSFDYSYDTYPDSLKDFDAFLIVNYQGDPVPIDTKLHAEESKSNLRMDSSFTVKLTSTFKIKK